MQRLATGVSDLVAFGCNFGDAARTVISGNAFWRGRPVVRTQTHNRGMNLSLIIRRG